MSYSKKVLSHPHIFSFFYLFVPLGFVIGSDKEMVTNELFLQCKYKSFLLSCLVCVGAVFFNAPMTQKSALNVCQCSTKNSERHLETLEYYFSRLLNKKNCYKVWLYEEIKGGSRLLHKVVWDSFE